ncbi:MAG TPA: alpha/beta hydrolase, partial [Thermoanaerobaculia bacterium]|nr:alpha/beta hydrolase [Thermoanaerobaculia bacterium]
AWEMRELFARLKADRRVLAYDLLGFGASDRPDLDYDADLYQDLLRDFLREVAGGPAHVVASSLSAAHALALAAEEPELFRSLALINPTGLLTQAERPGARGRVLQNLFRTPWLGEALYNLLVSRPSLRWFGSRIYRDPGPESATEERYAAAHQPGARYAPAAFLGNALAKNVYMALRMLEVPTLAVWSPSEYLDTGTEREAFAAVAPGVERATVEDCGAVPHEERPDEVVETLRRFWGGLV